MPSMLRCPCGKTLRVPESAGPLRVRCPACGAVHTAPGAEFRLDVVAEPGTKPEYGDAPAREGYGLIEGEANPPPPRAPEPRPPRPPRWRSRREAGKKRAQRQVYLGCGSLAVLVGIGLIVVVQITNDPGAVKVMIGGGLLAVFGFVSVVQALTNTVPDDDTD